MLLVDPGGIEPPSRMPSLRRNYNNSYLLLRRLVALALDAALVRAALALTNLPISFILSVVIHIVNDPVYGYTANYKHNSPKYIAHTVFKHET